MGQSRIESWIQALTQRNAAGVSIDDIGEVIGTDLATTEDIETLFNRLDALGIKVRVDASAAPPAQLRAVLLSARALRAKGERPTVENVALAVGLSVSEVRSALLYAQVLQR